MNSGHSILYFDIRFFSIIPSSLHNYFILSYFTSYSGKMQSKMAPNHDSFLLWAATDEERQMWIRIIRKVMFSSFGGGKIQSEVVFLVMGGHG